MTEINLVATAALLHDIGKFGQRADIFKHKSSLYREKEYTYTHAAYSAQVFQELGFNLGDTLSDDASMHHNPQNDTQWIIASADRMASGFEREVFESYNSVDSEGFKQQRLRHVFDEKKQFKIDVLSPNAIFPESEKALLNEYNALWEKFVKDFEQIKKHGNSIVDFFTIDYLMKKFTSFIPSSTSFEKNGYKAVKANIPLYEHSKASSIFASALWKLHENKNTNIVNYYKKESSNIEQNDLLMISGDFFGIQKFIFDSVPAAKASKILRAKSAYIQLLTKIVAFHVVETLGLSYQSIISTSAGKFEILGVNDEESQTKLASIQEELNTFFVKKYFGETGIGLSVTPCSLADFIVPNQYKTQLRPRIDEAVEAVKFKKFDLLQLKPVMHNDDNIDNETLCPLCSKRKKHNDYCVECSTFVTLGEKLAKDTFLIISKEIGQIPIFGDFYVSFSHEPHVYENNDIAIFDIANDETFRGYAKWELASYVKKEKEQVATFEDLAKSSCGGKDNNVGIKAIMSLKGDVDGMGNFIKTSSVTNSFARFNFFSRMVDYFFSVYAGELMKEKNIYTVFAGGDDIFVLGAWDEVIDFAKALREKFMEFSGGSGLSLSMGLVLTKPNKPINFVAHMAEEGLEKAKGLEGKDAISMFGECVKWHSYLDEDNALYLMEEFERFNQDTYELNTAFLYRLLEFIHMSKEVKKGDIKSTMWKSKLSSSFARNILEKVGSNEAKLKDALSVLALTDQVLEKYPQELKMALSEYIYKRRD